MQLRHLEHGSGLSCPDNDVNSGDPIPLRVDSHVPVGGDDFDLRTRIAVFQAHGRADDPVIAFAVQRIDPVLLRQDGDLLFRNSPLNKKARVASPFTEIDV